MPPPASVRARTAEMDDARGWPVTARRQSDTDWNRPRWISSRSWSRPRRAAEARADAFVQPVGRRRSSTPATPQARRRASRRRSGRRRWRARPPRRARRPHADVEAVARRSAASVRRRPLCPARGTLRRLKVRMDADLRVAEKAAVSALEPGGAVARRMDDEAGRPSARSPSEPVRARDAIRSAPPAPYFRPDPHGSIPPLPARRGARRLPALVGRVRSSSTISVSTSAALFPSPEPQQEYRSSTPLSARARPRPRRRRRRSRPTSRRPACRRAHGRRCDRRRAERSPRGGAHA